MPIVVADLDDLELVNYRQMAPEGQADFLLLIERQRRLAPAPVVNVQLGQEFAREFHALLHAAPQSGVNWTKLKVMSSGGRDAMRFDSFINNEYPLIKARVRACVGAAQDQAFALVEVASIKFEDVLVNVPCQVRDAYVQRYITLVPCALTSLDGSICPAQALAIAFIERLPQLVRCADPIDALGYDALAYFAAWGPSHDEQRLMSPTHSLPRNMLLPARIHDWACQAHGRSIGSDDDEAARKVKQLDDANSQVSKLTQQLKTLKETANSRKAEIEKLQAELKEKS